MKYYFLIMIIKDFPKKLKINLSNNFDSGIKLFQKIILLRKFFLKFILNVLDKKANMKPILS